MPLPASISVRNLVKRYGAIEAVRDVSFELFPGEIFGLLGQNGAGKTSVLECLLGLRCPDSGSIVIDGVNVLSDVTRAHEKIGAQLQFATLQDKITPTEALALFASFSEKPADTAKILAQFDLSSKAHSSFNSLSGGQQQRLFLALALVNQPEILVLDEPTAGLDPQSRRGLHRIISDLKAGGRTVILSTHNLEEAGTLCDRIGILHQGRMIANATPAALIAQTRNNPRVSFRTSRRLESTQVAALPNITNHTPHGDGWLVSTTDINRTISGLVRCLESSGHEMLDLQIHRPTLEDVFIELTGQVWREDDKEAETA
jgi:ABC-2 type transport system ATP-binding protein